MTRSYRSPDLYLTLLSAIACLFSLTAPLVAVVTITEQSVRGRVSASCPGQGGSADVAYGGTGMVFPADLDSSYSFSCATPEGSVTTVYSEHYVTEIENGSCKRFAAAITGNFISNNATAFTQVLSRTDLTGYFSFTVDAPTELKLVFSQVANANAVEQSGLDVTLYYTSQLPAPYSSSYCDIGEIRTNTAYIVLQPGATWFGWGTYAYAGGGGAEFQGSYTYSFEITFRPLSSISLVDALGTPFANSQFEISKVSNNIPIFSETLNQLVTTDADGKFILSGDFQPGDSVKISKILHSEPAKKHIGILGTMYSVSLDNAQFSSTSAMFYDELLDVPEQEIILDHTTVAYNALVSIEWDAATQYLERTQTAFRNMSNYLYDVTDGQARFDTIMIVDDKELWDVADFQINASNGIWPHVDKVGGLFRPTGVESDPVEMPRYWAGDEDVSRNLVQSDSMLDLTNSGEFRTRVHEYGHYGLKFKDEYVYTNAAGQCAAVSNYGFMDYQYEKAGDPYTSEMSNSGKYTAPACQNTSQWAKYGLSCWDLFQSDYESVFGPDNIFAEIYVPEERGLPAGTDYVSGPNDNSGALNYDVGALVVFPTAISAPAASAVHITVNDPVSNVALPKIAVGVELPGGTIIVQGYTSDLGDIYAFGASTGSIITGSGQATAAPVPPFGKRFEVGTWLSGSYVYDGSPGPVEVPVRAVAGSFPFNVRVDLNSPATTLDLDIEVPFSVVPILKHLAASTVGQSAFSSTAAGYTAVIEGSLADYGELRIEAVDAADSTFFVGIPYANHELSVTGDDLRVSSQDGSSLLEIDPVNVTLTQVVIASSLYPLVRTGLDPLAIQAGAAHSLAFSPNTIITGANALTIRYFDSDLQNSTRGFGDEFSLRIHHWNSGLQTWELIGGTVDTTFNEVTANITEAGVYAAFTVADLGLQPCGDANASGQIDIADVVYFVNYIFAAGPAPLDEAAGDFNCSGSVDIADAVYMVNFIFAGGPPPCAACN